MRLKIFTDGGSRGNPGEAAIGAVILNDENGVRLQEISQCIGVATNNIAEYRAVLEALEWVRDNQKADEIEFLVDSELIGKQLSGQYKVKDQNLKIIYLKIKQIIFELDIKASYTIVRREKNAEADALVNKALDERLNK